MKKVKSLFDHINQITRYKSSSYWDRLTEQDKKTWSTYMINRFLSMKEDWCSVVSYISKYNLEPKIYYRLLYHLIPKSNAYLKYIGKKKEMKINDSYVEVISRYYSCSKEEAKEYMKILKLSQIKEIQKLYGVNK